VRRWATVFPVGMYAASSFDAGRAANVPGLTDFARVWVWLALALWLLVFVAMLWHSWDRARGPVAQLETAASTNRSRRSVFLNLPVAVRGI
jgi:hypothetical protein